MHSNEHREECAKGNQIAQRSRELLPDIVQADQINESSSGIAQDDDPGQDVDADASEHDLSSSSALARHSNCLINVRESSDALDKVLSVTSKMLDDDHARNPTYVDQDLLISLDDTNDYDPEKVPYWIETPPQSYSKNERFKAKRMERPGGTSESTTTRTHPTSRSWSEDLNRTQLKQAHTLVSDLETSSAAGFDQNHVDSQSTQVSESSPHATSSHESSAILENLQSMLKQILEGQKDKGQNKVPEQVEAINGVSDVKQKETREAVKKPTSGLEATKELVRFTDAINRKFTFPYELCKTWTGMEELIKQAFFQDAVLCEHVQEGHYYLMGPGGEIILPQVWDMMVQPDWQVSMKMWGAALEEVERKRYNKDKDFELLMDPFAGLGLGGLGNLGIVDPGKKKPRKLDAKSKKLEDWFSGASGIPPPPGFPSGKILDPLNMDGIVYPGISPVVDKKKPRREQQIQRKR